MFANFPDHDHKVLRLDVTNDADFFLDPNDREMLERLETELGENNSFHSATGHYGDFVDLRLADDFPKGWRDRLVPMRGFDDVFGIDAVDMAVMKIYATSRSRLSRRLGGEMPDRGLKDIHTIVALLKAGLIARADVETRLNRMDFAPALTVECGRTFAEILALT